MARPATTELGVWGIIREALGVALRNPGLMASVLLLLLPCNLLLTDPKLSPRLAVNLAPLANRLPLPREPYDGESPSVVDSGRPPAEDPRFEELPIDVAPVKFVVEKLSMLATVYLSAVACKGRHSTFGALVSKVKRSWRKVVVSFLYAQLLYLIYPCCLLILGTVTSIFMIPTLTLFLVMLVLFSTFCILSVFLVYLDVPCQLSLVISAVEEDKGGIAALGKAFSFTRGRRLRGLVLTAVCAALHWLTRQDYAKMEITSLAVAVWQFAGVLVHLSAKLFGWLLWTVYYCECKKSYAAMG